MPRAILKVWLICLPNFLFCQIWSENFNNLPNGTSEYLPKWTSSAQDCDDGSISQILGDSFWGVLDGQFLVNDIEGFPCCSGLGSGGGGRQNQWLSEKISISNYCDVSISVDIFGEGLLECDSPNEPVFICTGLNPPDNSHDQIVLEYSLDGGSFQVFGYSCGSQNLGNHSISDLAGDSLQIRIWAGNSSNSEIYKFDNIQVNGVLREETSFNLLESICESTPPIALPPLSNEGTAGTWNFGETFNPEGFGGSFATLEFIPFPSECSLPFLDSIEVYQSSFSTFDTTICQNDSVFIISQFYHQNNSSGTETIPNSNFLGCDSIVEVSIDFFPFGIFHLIDTICLSQNIVINGNVYNGLNPTGKEILPNASFYGCDSIIFVTLHFHDNSINYFEPTICKEDSIIINGNTYNKINSTGTEILQNQNVNGCDSIIKVDLSFYNTTEELLNISICPEEEIIINGTTYNKNKSFGTEVFPNANQNGCDSIGAVSKVSPKNSLKLR